jgi:hypothetical protein
MDHHPAVQPFSASEPNPGQVSEMLMPCRCMITVPGQIVRRIDARFRLVPLLAWLFVHGSSPERVHQRAPASTKQPRNSRPPSALWRYGGSG